MPSDFPSFIESPFNTRVEYEEAKKLPEAERRLALHRAKKAPNTAPEAPVLLALPAPEPAASGGGGIRTLDVLSGTPVVLDQYGPVVVNTDGTISRITNWDRMSEAEREVAKRRIAKRNVERMKAFAAAGELKEELVSALQTPDAPPPDSPPPDAPPPPPHAPKTPKTELAPMPDKCPVVAPDSVPPEQLTGAPDLAYDEFAAEMGLIEPAEIATIRPSKSPTKRKIAQLEAMLDRVHTRRREF